MYVEVARHNNSYNTKLLNSYFKQNYDKNNCSALENIIWTNEFIYTKYFSDKKKMCCRVVHNISKSKWELLCCRVVVMHNLIHYVCTIQTHNSLSDRMYVLYICRHL